MYYATATEMERLDGLAVRSGLEIRQMMELAGWHMVTLFRMLKIPKTAAVAVAVGKGNKGGDGLAAARHLKNHGWKPKAVLLSTDIAPDAAHHLKLIRSMGVPVLRHNSRNLRAADVGIDALIGYHLEGNPRGAFKEAIEDINETGKVISYDLPSGVDATTGACLTPCVRADATLSLALPKTAFRTREGKNAAGALYVADIGIPAFLYDKIHPKSRPPFTDGLLKL